MAEEEKKEESEPVAAATVQVAEVEDNQLAAQDAENAEGEGENEGTMNVDQVEAGMWEKN